MISHLLKFSRYFENERADREIVTLKSYGWSSREIGKIKNMPSSTVRNRLAVLKKQIEKELGEPCGRRKHYNTYKT